MTGWMFPHVSSIPRVSAMFAIVCLSFSQSDQFDSEVVLSYPQEGSPDYEELCRGAENMLLGGVPSP